MAQGREIKRRIRSINNTKKITRAMELVSAAKMRKASAAVLATRPYANLSWQMVKNLSARTDPILHPLLKKRKKVRRIGIILVTSNRGLCAGFNREIIERTVHYLQRHLEVGAEIILIGKKGRAIMYKHGQKIAAEFAKNELVSEISEAGAIAKMAIQDYLAKKYDRIILAYTDFISSLSQKPHIRKLLPIEQEDEILGYVGKKKPEEDKTALEFEEYLFEPSPDQVLEQMLNRLVEMQIFQALLESNASEQAARMMAMNNATEAASDLVSDLNFFFNQARQADITKDLSEISASRAVLEA
jgi:F-type H+-transporting ATPase subunit gamma